MKRFWFALVYIAAALVANTASASDTDQVSLPPLDVAALEALREGGMKKLIFATDPAPVPDAAFQLADGAGTANLSDWRGKYVLLNFWATWCAPCRKEMPELDALQAEFGGDSFEVLTLATGRNSPQGIVKFFEENNITNLPRHADPKQALARRMAVLGLPITVLIDPEGREVARMRGDADWHSDSARAIVAALIGAPGDS